MSSRPNRTKLVTLAALAGSLALLTGCGKQAFVVTDAKALQKSPGHYFIPPKVDILLAEDDTGSMYEAYAQISQQLPLFLQGLESKGWDYHFATTALTNTNRPINQVAGSRYDVNWGVEWQPPFPGATPDLPGMIVESFFRKAGEYGEFIGPSDINNSLNGYEPGLEGIRHALYNRVGGSGFLRPDAMLVIIVVGNGQDTSGVSYCYQWGAGSYVPCEQTGGSPQTWSSSFNYYKQQYQALKASPSLVKFYAAVGKTVSSNCLGGTSAIGSRYSNMASQLGGASYDVCAQPISSILDSMSNHLQVQKLGFRTRYLFIAQRPDESSIRVTKYAGGRADQAQAIPQDPVNGWTYAGYVENVFAIDSPVPMNRQSGYAIELHGSAKLVGDDTADVTFRPYGAAPSSEQ
jgi:hypothetical protein